MMNIVTGKGGYLFIITFKSVLLSWTKRCLLFRWVVSVYLIVKQNNFFFSSLQCASSFSSPPRPQFSVPPMPLVMVHNHWCISDDVIIVRFTFLSRCCRFQFLWAPKWILEAKEKVIPYDASTVRIPSLFVKARFYCGLGNTWSSGNHLFHFLTSHVAHPTLNELLARS